MVMSTDPVSPALLNPAIPRDLETICLKCLQKDSPRRYASAEELADDLARFQAGKPVLARPLGRIPRAWRWCRRNRVVAALMLVVTTVAAGLAVTAGWLVAANRETTNQRNQAEIQRDRARDRLELAQEAAQQMLTEVSESPEMQAKGVELL